MTTTLDTVHATFDEIAAMAKEERELHPEPGHYRDVDAALEALRMNLRAYIGAARAAISLGNFSEAEHLQAKAAVVVAQAQPVWEARLDAAKDERERVQLNTVAPRAEWVAQLAGAYPPGRGVEVEDAKRALFLRLDALVCDLSSGDEAAFASVLDAMEGAAAAFQSSLGIARRESRLRAAADRAKAAVSAVSAEAA